MATGDVTGAKRPRYQANERFDSGDADAASRAPQDFDDALQRSLVTTPRAASGAVMPGMLVTGLSLTLNPTGPTDGKVRINTEVGIAIDANGRTIIKPNGLTVDVTIPLGAHQVYLFHQETPGDLATRRFLTVTTPFTEYPAAMNTTFQSTFGTHVRAGTNASTVADDVINGVTTPLVCIAIVSNAAGAITCVGYNAVTAPNGSDITNRLSRVSAPTTPPAVNTRNGSLQTLHDVIIATLYTIGQTAWKGSDFLTPAAGNNFGAYNIPAGGADKAFRQALGYITIGNGTTIIGDFNTSDYANCKLMLDAALATLPTAGGKLILKRGVVLTGFGGLTVTMPAKPVEIVGDNDAIGITPPTPQITFSAGEKFICDASNRLTLRDLGIQHIDTAVTLTNTSLGGFAAYGCFFTKPNSADSGAALQGVNVQNLVLEDVSFYTTVNTQYTDNAMAVRITGIGQNIDLRRVRHAFGGDEAQSLSIADVRDNFMIDNYIVEDDGGGFSPTAGVGSVMKLATTTNVDIFNRVIKNYRVFGNFAVALTTGNVSALVVDRMASVDTYKSVENTGAVPTNTDGTLTFRDCRWQCGLTDGGFVAHYPTGGSSIGPIVFERCQFIRTGAAYTSNESANIIAGANNTIHAVRFTECLFSGSKREDFPQTLININAGGAAGTVTEVIVERCRFEDFQNAAYTGAGGASILVGCTTTKCETLIVRDNTTYEIMSGTSGNPRTQAFLLGTGNTGSGGFYELVQVSGNRLGGSVGATPDQCGLWINTDQNVIQADISRNHISIAWDSGPSTAKWLSGSLFRVTSSSNTYGSMSDLKFDNNQIEVINTTGDAITSDLYFLDNTGTANVFGNSICNNTVYLTSADKFDYASAWGFNIPSYTHFNLAVAGNNCFCGDPGFLPDAVRIRFTGAVTNQFNDVTPGAGVQIAGNNGLFGNA